MRPTRHGRVRLTLRTLATLVPTTSAPPRDVIRRRYMSQLDADDEPLVVAHARAIPRDDRAEMSERAREVFKCCNVFDLSLHAERAHDGNGEIYATRIAGPDALPRGCLFLDYAELPPGTSIGVHRHPPQEEEFYLVLSGAGVMRVDGETLAARAGDLIRNPGGGVHGLDNTSSACLRLFIFALRAT